MILNVQWQIISDPNDLDFFTYVKKQKICNFQDAQKRRPRAEKSEMIIGGATGEMMKMAFLVNLAS